jgi:hypothetical protein
MRMTWYEKLGLKVTSVRDAEKKTEDEGQYE